MPGLLIVTAPSSVTANYLTSLPNVRDALGIADGNTAFDAFLTRLIGAASAIIAKHCGRVFAVEGLTEVFRSGPETGLSPFYSRVAPYGTPLDAQRRPIMLTRYPVLQVVSITDVTGPLVENVDFQVDYPAATLDRLFGVSIGAWSSTPVTVQYFAGYDLVNALPADLENVCLSMISQAYFAQGRDPNVASDSAQNVGATSFWQRTAAAMSLDDGLRDQLADYVNRSYS